MTALTDKRNVMAQHAMTRKLNRLAANVAGHSGESLAVAMRQAAECIDTLWRIKQALDAHATQQANTMLQQQARAAAAERARDEATGLLRDVWNRDGGKECRCINISRDTEREYENGHCPHQRIAAFLAASGGGK